MPRRNLVIATNEIYHIFNRSIAKENIFSSMTNLRKAFEIIEFYRLSQTLKLSKFRVLPKQLKDEYQRKIQDKSPLVEIYAFALMPNHYHLLLKQLQENGVSRFISNFQNSFAKVFNLKNQRDGALFQNSFKARRVETDEEFVHLSRYIHLNPITAFLIKFQDLTSYPWTSFSIYKSGEKNSFVNANFLLNMFKSKKVYAQFVADQVDYQRKLALIKAMLLD